MPEQPTSEIIDKLSTYIARLEEVEKQLQDPIVISSQVEPEPLTDDAGVKRVPILWPLYQHNMYYIVTVPANKEVRPHSHDEDVFRFVVKGSLTVNDIEITEGMWFVVRANTEYAITTKTGYTTFAGYRHYCRVNN